MKIKSPLSIQTDFSYELTLNYPVGDLSNQYGLVFGTLQTVSSGAIDPIEYFSINNNQKMFMGNRSWYSYFTELNEKSIIPSGNNTIKVFKIRQILYYFINNVYCYSSEIETQNTLNEFGFMVPSLGDVWIDNFQISKKGSTTVSSKVKQNVQFEFRMQPTDKFIQNKVNNQ